MPVFMVATGYKIIGQTVFIIAGLIAFALHEREAGMLLIGLAGGSLTPIAEKQPVAELPRVTIVKE